MFYRVRIGEDVYLGRAEEVVAFMARAEGAPGDEPASYMAGVAARLRDKMGIEGVDTSDPGAFLDSLDELKVLSIEILPEPSEERVDPENALGDGPVTLGEGVDPYDVPL